jgi:hypothetical protein
MIFLSAYLKSVFYLMQESEVSIDGNQWIAPVLKSMRRSSPTALKITLQSVLILTPSLICGQFGYGLLASYLVLM